LLLTLAATWSGQQSLAWGAAGHEWATEITIETLPDDIPASVRNPAIGTRADPEDPLVFS
jgi:hypothetical protein